MILTFDLLTLGSTRVVRLHAIHHVCRFVIDSSHSFPSRLRTDSHRVADHFAAIKAIERFISSLSRPLGSLNWLHAYITARPFEVGLVDELLTVDHSKA